MPEEKLELVVQKLDPKYTLVRSWPLTGGASAQMTALEVVLPDGMTQKVILRQPGDYTLSLNPHAAADEFRLLQSLHAAGLPTSTPLYCDNSGELLPTPYLVVEYIEGENEFQPANLSDFVSQAAMTLARIHSVDGNALNLSFLPRQTRVIAERFGARPANPDSSSDEARIWEALEAVGTIPQTNPDRLVHGDFWPGNWLWREGQLVAVIDWEDAVIGDPLADFAISRLDALLIFGQSAMVDFTHYYQSAMPHLDFSSLSYWDLCAALRAAPNLAEWAAGYPALGRPDITEMTMRTGHKWFMAQALEMLSKPSL